MNWRDILASVADLTPSYGYAWPSTVGGRFYVPLAAVQLVNGRKVLRDRGLDGLADCLHADPYSTAKALVERYDRSERPVADHRPSRELADDLARRVAIDAERQRIWAAIQAWTEVAHRLDDNGHPVAVGGTEFRPLAPFFRELAAMVFDEGNGDSDG